MPEQIARAIVAVFGIHPGYRLAFAKGIVATGTFTPTADATSISRAAHFARTVPVAVRFSDFAGVPTIPSNDPNASPSGIAIKFNVGGSDTDLVGHSANAFPAATGEEFRDFLRAIAASPAGAPKPNSIDTYLQEHPAALYFVNSIPPPPVSYATTSYFMLNAYKFTNESGKTAYGRYSAIPLAGVQTLESAAADAAPPDYLREELMSRLAGGPVVFNIVLQVAEADDSTNDSTQRWPAARRIVDLGAITLVAVHQRGADPPGAPGPSHRPAAQPTGPFPDRVQNRPAALP